ncbi:hypothetical protein M9H77_24401 [Catharanthus roseus]|uniref:Uncharacterized protein n=1 Tax=Catharanthus roseus TaxID=4058 RepID=A0ACC0B005_CATRO|nr:hypothetical protein M9H77_24401 [Catharanthus roseus]
MAQKKVKRLLAHSSIGHVGYIRTGLSCGTIEGIQSLLIGIFIYASMTIDAFAIVLALRQTRVKYIADLGALAKTVQRKGGPLIKNRFQTIMLADGGPPLFFSLMKPASYYASQLRRPAMPWAFCSSNIKGGRPFVKAQESAGHLSGADHIRARQEILGTTIVGGTIPNPKDTHGIDDSIHRDRFSSVAH